MLTDADLAVSQRVVVATVRDSRLHVLEKVAHVRLVQRHVPVKNFQRRRLLGGRDNGGGGGINGPRSVTDRRGGPGGDRRRRGVVAGDGRRLDDGRGIGQVQPSLGRRRQQRDERAHRDDVDEDRNHDAVAPDKRASSTEQPRRHGNEHLLTTQSPPSPHHLSR